MEKIISNSEYLDESYKVPNLEKGIAVLEYLSLHPAGKSLQNIKTHLNLSQTTTYRILKTLARLEYLLYDEHTKCYKVSRKLLTMGFRSLSEHNMLELVLPRLSELRDSLKETVCFGVLGTDKGVFIEQAKGLHTFSFVLSPGKLFELHCSAPGKAIMAYLPNNIRNQYLAQMVYTQYNQRTIACEADYLIELKKVLKNGYAVDNGEELEGVICVGAPLFNYNGYPAGAIWISGPKQRLTPEVVLSTAEEIMSMCRLISEEMGYIRRFPSK